MKTIFSSRRNKLPHNNEGKERTEGSFFSKQPKQPFFNVPNGGAVQTKLTVGQPGDKYEKEADTMADAVVNKSISKPAIQNKEISSIQRESLATPVEDEKLGTAEQRMEEDKLVQEKPEIQRMEHPEEEMLNKMDNEEEEPIQKMGMAGTEKNEELQTKSNSSTANTASTAVANKISSKSGKGKKMPTHTKAEMEGSFDRDFSNVSIHTDQDAVSLNKELGAQAFTHGNDVYFNSGKYNPDSSQGKHLLAHELTHVLQQNSLEKRVQRSSKKLKDHDKGFLNVKNETDNAVYPLSFNAEVDFKNANGGREYFTAQEWPHRNKKSSVKGSGRFTTGPYNGPASVKFWKSQMKLEFGNGTVVKAFSDTNDPIGTGTHKLMLPDYPHKYGYIEDSDFSYAWFRIGKESEKYLHIGNVTLGCITIGAEETGAPEHRKKWTSIYKYLINSRAGDNESVGTITVYD